jgi:alcohol dehydrogenase class IV
MSTFFSGSTNQRWRFWVGPELHFGRGILEELPRILSGWGTRVLLVGYLPPSPLDPIYERLNQKLAADGFEVYPFLRVAHEPTLQGVEQGFHFASNASVDVVVAVGGGSVLDTGKAIAYQIRQSTSLAAAFPRMFERDMHSEGSEKRAAGSVSAEKAKSAQPRNSPALVLVPTRPGSGAEVTEIAVFRAEVVDPSFGPVPVKWAFAAPEMKAQLALVDGDLLSSCQAEQLFCSLGDAIGHAVESSLSRAANPFTIFCAGHALEIFQRGLSQLAMGPSRPETLLELAQGSVLAGIAVNIAGAGVAHAIAHGLGAVLGLPHAEAVSVALPAAMRFNFSESVPRLAGLARFLGFPTGDHEHAARSVVAWVADAVEPIRRRVLRQLAGAIGEETFERVAISAAVSSRLVLRLNPRRVRSGDLLALSREVLSQDSSCRQE